MCPRSTLDRELKVGYVGEPVELGLPTDIKLLLRVIVQTEVDAAKHPRDPVGLLDGFREGPLHACGLESVQPVL